MQASRITALGGVFLTAAIVMIQVRMEDAWAHGVQFAIAGVCFLLLFALAFGGGLGEDDRPSAAQSTLLVSGLVLLVATTVRFGQVTVGRHNAVHPGTVVWLATLYALIALFASVKRRSAVCLLAAAVALGVAAVEFVEWIDSSSSIGDNGYRWIFFGLMLLYGAVAVALRGSWRRHGAQMVNASMIALLALLEATSALIVVEGIGGRPSTWWRIVVIVGALAGVVYGLWTRERGPSWLGGTALLFSVAAVGIPAASGGSLVGWPLILLVLATLALIAGLAQPRRT
jgi:hypothetical protein